MKRLNIFRFMPKVFVITFGVGLLIVVALFTSHWWGFRKNLVSRKVIEPAQTQADLLNSKKEMNQEFLISLREVKEAVKYEVVSAELLEEINLRGQKVRAADNRIFLIFNIKITNPNTTGVQINSRDYVRISSFLTDDWIAPDIHNDPIEVQALSAKYTRIGFAVDNTTNSFRVKTGEIKGEKVDFELVF